MTVSLKRDQGFSWFTRNGIHAKGYLFDGGDRYFEKQSLLQYFAAVTNVQTLRQKALEANGAFAVVVDTDRHLLAAVDRLRSIPLFYRDDSADMVIGDEVRPLLSEADGNELDPIAKEEFLRAGYTLLAGTLHPHIKQLGAGELLCYDKASGRLTTEPYFSHCHGDYVDKTPDALCRELDDIYRQLVNRLITCVQGRTIVVPLSGGYDSRSLVCVLKQAGFKNVVCYTYGASPSFEPKVAQHVAAELGYPIHVVYYNRQKWSAVLDAPWFAELCQYVFQDCAVPNLQEVLAWEELTRTKAVPQDAVIVPGYCCDLLGGSWVPEAVAQNKAGELLAEGIDNYIFRTNFRLSYKRIRPATKQAILDHIHAVASRSSIVDVQDFSSAVDNWCATERVAKFTVNILREFEWFGHAWRIPLWDNQLIEWWYRIPLKFRIGSALYHQWLFEHLFDPMHVGFRKPPYYHQDRIVRPDQPVDGRWEHTFRPLRWQDVLRKLLPWWFLKAVRPINLRTFAKRCFTDVNDFDDVGSLLRARLPKGKRIDSYTPMNGAMAEWLLVQPRQPWAG